MPGHIELPQRYSLRIVFIIDINYIAISMLNRDSGLKGLSGGQSGDSRDVEENLTKGCPKAKLAVDAFCYRQGDC